MCNDLSPQVAIDCSDRNAAYRINLPEEEWLWAVLDAGNAAVQAVLDDYGRREEPKTAREQEKFADLEYDVLGLERNLTCFSSGVQGVLHRPENLAELVGRVEQLARCMPVVNSVTEDTLLWTLAFIFNACAEVSDIHDAAHPDGTCQCLLCSMAFGVSYNVGAAIDLIGGPLKSLSRLDLIDHAQQLVDGDAEVDADSPLTAA
jgi:hypothetical protein